MLIYRWFFSLQTKHIVVANQLDIFYYSLGRVTFSYKIITDFNLWIDDVLRGLRWNLR